MRGLSARNVTPYLRCRLLSALRSRLGLRWRFTTNSDVPLRLRIVYRRHCDGPTAAGFNKPSTTHLQRRNTLAPRCSRAVAPNSTRDPRDSREVLFLLPSSRNQAASWLMIALTEASSSLGAIFKLIGPPSNCGPNHILYM